MRVPVNGEKLVSANGDVWVILRCHQARDDPRFFAVDVIRQQELRHASRAVNFTWDEFEEFCRTQGIAYPPD